MFGTIILDSYSRTEVNEIAYALDDLCSPNDNYGWASTGIYCYWNYYTKEILYIGLAVDLTERFKQHNGIISCLDGACKKNQIEEYFSKYDVIGFTIFVQSPLSQPITSKNADFLKVDPETYGFIDLRSDPARDDVKRVEGILIEAYRLAKGDIPEWNKVGGSIAGQQAATPGNYEIIKCFSLNPVPPLTSRYTLRELSANPTFERYENFMHAIRMLMLSFGCNFKQASDMIRRFDILDTFEEMIEVGYFSKQLNI